MYRASLLPIASLVLIVLGSQFFSSFFNCYLKALGIDQVYAGFLHAGFYGGMLFGSMVAPWLIAKLSHARSFAIATAFSGFAILSIYLANSFLLWLAMRILAGGALGIAYVTVEGWLLYFAGESQRGRAFALYMVALYLSQTCSQLLRGWILMEEAIPFIVAALFCLLATLPLLCEERLLYCRTEQEPLVLSGMREMLYKTPLGVFGCFLSGMLLSGIYSFLAPFALSLSLPDYYMMGATIFGGVCGQMPLGFLSDRFDRQKVLIASSILLLVPVTLLLLYPFGYMPYLYAFFLGMLAFTLYPQSTAVICEQQPSSAVTAACGVAAVGYGLGAVIAPLLLGVWISYAGEMALLYFLSILLQLFLVYAFASSLLTRWWRGRGETISIVDVAPAPIQLSYDQPPSPS